MYYLSNMNKLRFFFLLCALCCASSTLVIAQVFPYQNAQLSVDMRVKDLLSRMTLEEKFYQLFMIAHDDAFDSSKYRQGIFGIEISIQGMDDQPGQQMLNYNETWTARKQVEEINRIQHFLVNETRLGIPGIFYGEALHGVVGKGGVAYPQSIALAASFNRDLMSQVCDAIALESQQRGWRQVLSPVVNVATDVRWGRVEETYGEDPYLSAVMGSIFVRAFEGKGIITTPKHFVANVGDGGRDSYPMHLDSMALANIHYPPFKACVDAGCRSIMTSYNSLNGQPCSMNNELLNNTLKKDWGFKGFVISDAGAVGGANVLHNNSRSYSESGRLAIENGLDVIFQTSIRHDDLFKQPFLNGEVNGAALDSAVARVLRAKFELGLFENPYAEFNELPIESFQALAMKAAEESMVLLKNDKQTLPFQAKGKRLLVIGKDAQECRLGGYSGSGYQKVAVLDAIKSQWGDELSTLEFIEGPGRGDVNACAVIPDDQIHGLEVELYNGANLKSEKVKDLKWSKIDFHYTFYAPDVMVKKDDFRLVMDGEWETPVTGEIEWGLVGNDGYKMWVRGEEVINRWSKIGHHTDLISMKVKQGERIPFHIEFYESLGNAELKMIWRVKKSEENNLKSVIEKAKKADMVLFVAGIAEGEFQDRSSLNLPGEQEVWIQALGAISTPLVVAISGGSAVEVTPWINNTEALIDMWYAGEQQGNALVNILEGKINPSGKLPITFPMNEGQLPLNYWHEPTGRGDDYIDGTGWPMYPFGFGLSYSEFEYGPAMYDRNDKNVLVVPVTNVGAMDGSEVVQLYLQSRYSRQLRPIIQLVDFQKVFIEKGKTVDVLFNLDELKKRGNLNFNDSDQLVWAIGKSSRELVRKLEMR
jgi:beta-glucosidase